MDPNGAGMTRPDDPRSSVWVSASAGTGKTTVLVDRLLRLMLDGTDPARVLCLTFTRAAAAEMANRLDGELAKWATLPAGELERTLTELTGKTPDDALATRARRLFAAVLDTPGGIKIATIHAFCQGVLHRFPLEAGISPEFSVIEERGAGEALVEAGQRVIVAALEGKDPELAAALSVVAGYAPEERFGDLIAALAAERGKLRRAMSEGHAGLRRRLAMRLGLGPADTLDALLAAFCAEGAGDEARLRAAATALAASGSADDRNRGAVLSRWCESPDRRREIIDAYVGVYVTDKDKIRKNLIVKAADRAAGGDVAAILAVEAERVLKFRDCRAGHRLLEASCALVRLGDAVLRTYERDKRTRGLLDFDDLVEKTLELLHRPGLAPWVLFKLDGGLDHILIDEAQDTNPEQWRIVAALAEEFFTGEGARDRPRTIFAVGDPKQSIFSFQRADPRAFAEMRRHFEQRAAAANRDWRVLPLEISFRSTEPVLRGVDAIFARRPALDGVVESGGEIRHFAKRTGHAGLVELWPSVAPEPEAEAELSALPVDRRRIAEPRTRLARAIAAKVARWLADGELLAARGRPVRAGDIMILVRRRDAFVAELLHALKARRVAVAGADRLVLADQLAVQDLTALGRFLLFPEDDLTLAAVLKGPLFGIDEETLFDLAYGRGDASLWSRLRDHARSRPALQVASQRLSAWLARADFAPPYELYAEILGPEGGRRAFFERLGPEAEDPVEEFLGLALAYEREHVPSLQGFLRWLAAGGTEVKRDLAARRRDEVRILTVHGAKGLEAPIVFLPDTMGLPDPRVDILWSEPDGLPLWQPPGGHAAPFHVAEKAAWRRRQLEEYRRLLYVGLTRAQDRLYICGWETRRKSVSDCWHALCRIGLTAVAQPFAFDTKALIGDDGWSGEGLRLESAQLAPAMGESAVAAAPAATGLPEWVRRPPPAEPDPPRPLAPSRSNENEPAAFSPLALRGRDRFKRGLLVHRLLQSLPELPASERDAAARRYLALPVHALGEAEQDEIRRETLAVLAHADLAPLFGPDSLAEVPLVGLVGGRALAGQIDRLVVGEDRVLIVDYKTMRPAPLAEDGVAPIYLRQLASYRAALARIYPGREIRCALLWTEGPHLMPISAERLAGYAPAGGG
jgi:ATP-dependent helicase/nuclease subunit A